MSHHDSETRRCLMADEASPCGFQTRRTSLRTAPSARSWASPCGEPQIVQTLKHPDPPFAADSPAECSAKCCRSIISHSGVLMSQLDGSLRARIHDGSIGIWAPCCPKEILSTAHLAVLFVQLLRHPGRAAIRATCSKLGSAQTKPATSSDENIRKCCGSSVQLPRHVCRVPCADGERGCPAAHEGRAVHCHPPLRATT